jgi:dihydroorotate dehydrogenase electron transfer subunit
LVAGGMGVAPLLGLAEELAGYIKGNNKFIVILGAKTENHIFCEKEFKKLGAKIYIATEDGSKGKRALATELAEEIIKSSEYKRKDVCIYGAGPIEMIKVLCRLVEGCSIESQVSLEERMACGLGACLGCAIETQSGYKRVCKDGPVFNMCEVVYN